MEKKKSKRKIWIILIILLLIAALGGVGAAIPFILKKPKKDLVQISYISESEVWKTTSQEKGVEFSLDEALDGAVPIKQADAQYSYICVGWSLTSVGVQEYVENLQDLPSEIHLVTTYTAQTDTTFYAVFTRKQKSQEQEQTGNITVSFVGENNESLEGEEYQDKKVKPEDTITLPDAPQKAGHTFLGWSDGRATYGANQEYTVTARTRLQAVYCKNKYKLVQHVLGNTSQRDVEFESALALTTPQADEVFVFGGWFYDQDFQTRVQENDLMGVEDNGLDVYAKFEIDLTALQIACAQNLAYGKQNVVSVSGLATGVEGLEYSVAWAGQKDGQALAENVFSQPSLSTKQISLKNAGQYSLEATVVATFTNGENGEFVLTNSTQLQKAVSVEKATLRAQINVQNLVDGKLVYGNTAKVSAQFSGFVNGDEQNQQSILSGKTQIVVSLQGGQAVESTAQLDVGKYIAQLQVGELENYNVLPAENKNFEVNFEVTPATLTVSAQIEDFVYGEKTYQSLNEDAAASVRYEGFVFGQSTAALSGSVSLEISGQEQKGVQKDGAALVDAGEYNIALSGLDSKNYNIVYVGDNFSVAKKQAKILIDVQKVQLAKVGILSVKSAAQSSFVYGDSLNFTLRLEDVLQQDEASFALQGLLSKDSAAENIFGSKDALSVGTYTFQAQYQPNDNYEISVQRATSGAKAEKIEFEIEKATITISAKVENANLTYGQTPQFSRVAQGLVYGQQLDSLGLEISQIVEKQTESAQSVSAQNAQGAPIAYEKFVGTKYVVGKYKVSYAGTLSTQNYNIIYAPAVEFEVQPKALKVNFALQGATGDVATYVYGNAPKATLEVGQLEYGEVFPLTAAQVVGFYKTEQTQTKVSNNKFDVGSYVAKIELSTLEQQEILKNYRLVCGADVNFEISKASLTISFELAGSQAQEAGKHAFTYGTKLQVSVSAQGFVLQENFATYGVDQASIVVFKAQEGLQKLEKTDALHVGNYVAALEFDAEQLSNYQVSLGENVDFEITKKALSVVLNLQKENFVYGYVLPENFATFAFEGFVSGEEAVLTQNVHVVCQKLHGEQVELKAQTKLGAGTYQVFIDGLGDLRDYQLDETLATKQFVVQKKTAHISVLANGKQSESVTYSADLQFSAKISNLEKEDEHAFDGKIEIVVKQNKNGEKSEYSLKNKFYDAGEYEVTVKDIDAENYDFSVQVASVEVLRKNFSISTTQSINHKAGINFVLQPKFDDDDAKNFAFVGSAKLKNADVGTYNAANAQDFEKNFTWQNVEGQTNGFKIVLQQDGQPTGDDVTENFEISYNVEIKVTNSIYERVDVPSAEKTTFVYDGNAHEFAVKVTVGEAGVVPTISYKVSTNGEVAEEMEKLSFTDAGTYKVEYSISAPNYDTEDGQFVVTISQAQGKISVPQDLKQTFTYSGTQQEIDFSDVTDNTKGQSAPSFSTTGKKQVEGKKIVFTNVADLVDLSEQQASGTFDVTITLAESKNYLGAQETVQITINKAQFVVSAADQTQTYNAKAFGESSVQVQTFAQEDKYQVLYRLGEEGQFVEEVPQITNVAQSGTVYYKVCGNDNYICAEGNYKLSITRATISASASSDLQADGEKANTFKTTFDAQQHGATLNVTAADSEYEILYKTDADADYLTAAAPQFVNAGTHTVYYQISGENYETLEGSYTINIEKFDLSKATLTLVDSQGTTSAQGGAELGVEFEYDLKTHTISLKVSGTPDENLQITYSYTQAGAEKTTAAPTFKNVADSGEVSYEISGENYVTKTGTFSVRVNKKAATASWNDTLLTKENANDNTLKMQQTYNGSKFGALVTVSGTLEGDEGAYTISYTYQAENAQTAQNAQAGQAAQSASTADTTTTQAPMFANAGTYKVKYKISSANYTFAGAEEGEFEIVIDQAQGQINLGEQKWQTNYTYDAKSHTIDLSGITDNTSGQSELRLSAQSGAKTVAIQEKKITFTNVSDVVEFAKPNDVTGTLEITVTLEGSQNYKGATEKITVQISKATYKLAENGQDIVDVENKIIAKVPTIAETQIMKIGKTLGDVAIPQGAETSAHFAWKTSTAALLLGINSYEALFNADAGNYVDLQVKLTVSARKEVLKVKVDSQEKDLGTVADATAAKALFAWDIVGEDGSEGGRKIETSGAEWQQISQYISTNSISVEDFVANVGTTYAVKYELASSENDYFELQAAEDANVKVSGASVSGYTYLKVKSVKVNNVLYTIEDALKEANNTTATLSQGKTAFADENAMKNVGLYGIGAKGHTAEYAQYHTIKAGTTLLLPLNETDTGVRTLDGKDSSLDYTKAYGEKGGHYSELSVSDGTQITVNGTLVVNAARRNNSGAATSYTAKDIGYATMELQGNSNIILENDSTYYCYGYTYGTGTISAKSGSTTYEPFAMQGWKGGTIALKLSLSGGPFPLNQYSLSNIASHITFQYGANYKVQAALSGTLKKLLGDDEIQYVDMSINFVSSKNDAFLQMSENATIEKWINEGNGEINFVVNGNVTFNNISISVAGVSASTSGKQVPIPGNFKFELASGIATIPTDVALKMLPGAELYVRKDAQIVIKKATTSLFTKKVAGAYSYGSHGVSFDNDLTVWRDGNNGYAYPHASWKDTYRVAPTADFDATTPAIIQVEGIITVEDGGILAGEISGKDDGQIVVEKGATTLATIKEDNSPAGDGKTFTSTIQGLLLNEDGSTTNLQEGTATYSGGKWTY